jgi:hypothetical protein
MTAVAEGAHHLLDVDVQSVLGQRAMVIENFHELRRVAIAAIAFFSPIMRATGR